MGKVELQTNSLANKKRKVACFLNVLRGKENTGLCLNSVIRHHQVCHSNLILTTGAETDNSIWILCKAVSATDFTFNI